MEAFYAAAAAWSGSGIADLTGYLARLAPGARSRLLVDRFAYHQTPRPERLNAEAQ